MRSRPFAAKYAVIYARSVVSVLSLSGDFLPTAEPQSGNATSIAPTLELSPSRTVCVCAASLNSKASSPNSCWYGSELNLVICYLTEQSYRQDTGELLTVLH